MAVTRSNRQRGFSLLELMVVLTIVSVLGLLTVPVLQLSQQRVKEQELRHALREIRAALDAYKRAAEEGEIDTPATASGYPPSLELLVEGVAPRLEGKKKNTKLYFLRRVPRDPLNDRPDISASATWGKRSFDSEATDPREGEDIYDVFSLSPKVGLNAIPYALW
jgi:general secretion pathway protein G